MGKLDLSQSGVKNGGRKTHLVIAACNNRFSGDGFRAGKRTASSPGSSSEPTHTLSLSQEYAVKYHADLQPGKWEKFRQGLMTRRLDTFCSMEELSHSLTTEAITAQLFFIVFTTFY